jgi:hypothetical protein
MTVNVSKPALNVREKLAELDKPTGIAGEAMLRAETPQEQFQLINAGRRNILINGIFDIWQRNTSFSFSNTTYTSDRWLANGGASSGGSFTVSQQSFSAQELGDTTPSYYIRFTSSGASGGWVGPQLFQRIERDGNRLFDRARSFTVSFYAKSSDLSAVQVRLQRLGDTAVFSTEDCSLTSSWQKFTRTISLPTDFNTSRAYDEFAISMPVGENGTVDIAQVQLEVGKVATPFEHRSYGEELALCQRYFFRFDPSTLPCFATNTTRVLGSFTFPTSMRAVPTRSGTNVTNMNIWYVTNITGVYTYEVAPTTVDHSTISYVYSSGTNFTQGTIHRPNGSFSCDYDAEL